MGRMFDFIPTYQDFSNGERNYSNPSRLFPRIYSNTMEIENQIVAEYYYNEIPMNDSFLFCSKNKTLLKCHDHVWIFSELS